jgi:hypothetical protein
MKLGNLTFIALALLGTASSAVAADVEEIYIARSVRESRIMGSTEFCARARTGIDNPVAENQLTLRSLTTGDGHVLDANVRTIGNVRNCVGSTTKPGIVQFYGDFAFLGLVFRGVGECNTAKSNFPERSLSFTSCVVDLSGLPGEYVGGQLTSSGMNSLKPLGAETEPPGYTQSAIAVIRLWKKRDGR